MKPIRFCLLSTLMTTLLLILVLVPFDQQAKNSTQAQFRSAKLEIDLSNLTSDQWSQVSPVESGLGLNYGKETAEITFTPVEVPLSAPEPAVSIAADWSAA